MQEGERHVRDFKKKRRGEGTEEGESLNDDV